MKRADFMDMSNISWHKSIKRGHFMDGNINQPGFSIELYSPERGCHEVTGVGKPAATNEKSSGTPE
jgi:hypothetical protein